MQKPTNPHDTLINARLLTCKGKCSRIDGYVGLKCIPYAFERGYKKCTVCQCYFLHAQGYIRCKCCNYKLKVTQRRRKKHVRLKVEKFKKEIAVMEVIPRGRNNSLCL